MRSTSPRWPPAPDAVAWGRREVLVATVLVVAALSLALLAGHAAGVRAAAEAGPGRALTLPGPPALPAIVAALLAVAAWWRLERLRRRLAATAARAASLARHDELTGALSRRAVIDRLGEELARARRYRRRFSLALLDVDGLGSVNQAVGHEGGDAVLKAVGETVRSQIRQTDSVGRSRDDELLVLLPETDATGARTIAERLRQAIAVVPVLYAGMNLEANVSIGLTTFSAAEEPHLSDVELLLQRADQALFQAKSSGRNRVEDGAARLLER